VIKESMAFRVINQVEKTYGNCYRGIRQENKIPREKMMETLLFWNWVFKKKVAGKWRL
jgi:hypothetical protein